MKSRRVLAPACHMIAAGRGSNRKALGLAFVGTIRPKALAISLMGREWFPGGPYNQSRRGSIPRRSTFFYYNKFELIVKR